MMDPQPQSPTELHRQRETIRRGMLQANTAAAVVLGAILLLAVAAVVAGVAAARSQHRAEQSEQQHRAQLWQSYVEQARATRLSGLAGARARALQAIANAAAMRPTIECRNEAITSLGLIDLQEALAPRPTLSGDVRFCDLHPRLETFVAVQRSGHVEQRRLEDGQLLAVLPPEAAGLGTNRVVTWARLSPNGEYLGLGFLDSALVVWRLSDAQLVLQRNLPGPGYLIPPTFSADGRWFAYQNPQLPEAGGLSLFELATGREVPLPGVAPYFACAVAPEKPLVAVASNRVVRVIDFLTGKTLHTLNHPADVGCLEWSNDGRKLAVACVHGDVFLWDFDPEHFHVFTGHSEFVATLRFSPDARLLATSGSDRTTRLWDCEQGHEVLRTPDAQVLRFNQDGSQIGFVRGASGVGVWQVVHPKSVRTFPVRAFGNEPNLPHDLSASGRWLAALAPTGLHLWDLNHPTAEWFEPLPAATNRQRFPSGSVTFHPAESSLLLCYAGRLEWWRRDTNAAGEWAGIASRKDVPLPPGAEPRQATLNADGRTVLVELANARLVVIDSTGERPPVFLEGRGRLFYPSLAGTPTGAGRFVISPDGRFAAVGKDVGPNRGPTVWDAQTGRTLFSADLPGLASFSPNGERFASSAGGQYVHFHPSNGQPLRTNLQPALGEMAGFFAWPRDTRRMMQSRTRQSVELIESETGTQVAEFTMPERQSAAGLRLSHDGHRLVVATARHLLIAWDLAALRRELAELGLDWPEPGEAPNLMPAAHAPSPRSLWSSPTGLAVLGLASAGLAGFFAWTVLRRHRTLVHEFVQADALVQQRNRELEMARVELLHSQKMKALGTLAAGIAHDFNNLLSVVRMSNKLIGREVPDHPEVREHVATIEDAVQQGKQVVGSMLGFSRAQPGEAALRDVDELIEETVAILSREFLSGIALTLELDRNLPPVRVGAGKIEQIILNLVVNAAEAMNGQGKLRLATRARSAPSGPFVLAPQPAPAYVELTVTDTGPGMLPDVQERIFEPFFTTKQGSNKPGTGLGLSMVYTVAEQDGLGLKLETGPGQGTSFTVLIPVPKP